MITSLPNPRVQRMSASHAPATPWWHTPSWRATIALMSSILVVGFGYIAWWAEHQKPEDNPPTLAFVLIPFAAIVPAFPDWPQFIFLAVLNIALWATIAYSALAMLARWRQ